MATGGPDGTSGRVVGGIGRRLDPRASVTGKFVAAGAASTAVTVVVVAATVWGIATASPDGGVAAGTLYRVGALAAATIVSANLVAFALVERSVVGGLRELDLTTRRVAETGRYDVAFDPDRKDEVGQLAWSVAEVRDQLASQVDTVESLNRDLAATATEQTRTLSACRDGDLTSRMDEDTGIPQFDALATSFNATMDRMETMVGEVRAFSQTVADAAHDADEKASQAQAGTVAVTEATESIRDGVERQHAQLERTATAMDDLVENVEAVAARSNAVADTAETAARVTHDGAGAANEALTELEAIERRIAASVAEIESLSRTVDEVTDLADRMRELTEQTEHLAMNTELEAKKNARDGSMSHLGEQIRELSADTEAAAADIEAGLASVEADTESALAEIERTEAAVERGTETIGNALGSFERVEELVAETDDAVGEIDAATDAQTDRAAEVRSSVVSLRQIGAETANEAADVAGTASDQQVVIEAIEDHVEWLATGATQLEDALETFTVRPPETTPQPVLEGDR